MIGSLRGDVVERSASGENRALTPVRPFPSAGERYEPELARVQFSW